MAACTSSPEVRELAERTAANTGTLAAAIESMAQQSRGLAERRATNAARLAAAAARVESQVELDRALLQRSGDSSSLSTFEVLKTWSDKAREIEAEAAIDEKAFIRNFLKGRSDIESRSKALSEVAKILAGLAKEESVRDRAKFLFDFGEAVYDQVKEKQKEADAAVKAGEKKLVAGEADGGS
jgi:hypothetical protein